MDYLSQKCNLSSTGRYIYITPNYKIINPVHDAQIFKYSGPIEGYDFKNQKKNLESIQKILENKGSRLTYVFVGRFIGDYRIKTSFIAHSDDKKIWWRKFEGKMDGNSEQVIFEDGKKIKLKKWLANYS